MKNQPQKSISGIRLLFVCYCAVMLYLLFIRNRSGIDGMPYWEQVQKNYNCIPFRTIRNFWDILARPEYYLSKWEEMSVYRYQARQAIINLVGNVVLFVPLGYLLPASLVKLRKFFKSFLAAFGMILAVELIQLFSLRGSCDVDDLILNLSGVIAGYALWRLVHVDSCKRK